MTYVFNSFIDGSYIPDALKILYKKTLSKKNPVWFYAFKPAEMNDYLSRYSLHLIADFGHEEFRERYIKPQSRDLMLMEIERIVLAEVK